MAGGTSFGVRGTAQAQGSATVDISGIGVAAGDMVLCWSFGDGFGTPATPTNYTLIESGGGTEASYMLAYRTITGSGDTSSIGGLTPDADFGHIVVVVSGADVLDVTTPAATTNTIGDPTPPAITTATDGAMVVMFGAIDDDITTLTTVPTSGTALTFPTNDYYQIGSSGAGGTVFAAYLIKETAGLYTPTAFVTPDSDGVAAMTIAIRPA